jgi:hypothetical protein
MTNLLITHVEIHRVPNGVGLTPFREERNLGTLIVDADEAEPLVIRLFEAGSRENLKGEARFDGITVWRRNDHASVWLTGAGDRKISVIKAIREILPLGLKDAKDLVDSCSSPGGAQVLRAVAINEAKAAQQHLLAAGATVELR